MLDFTCSKEQVEKTIVKQEAEKNNSKASKSFQMTFRYALSPFSTMVSDHPVYHYNVKFYLTHDQRVIKYHILYVVIL